MGNDSPQGGNRGDDAVDPVDSFFEALRGADPMVRSDGGRPVGGPGHTRPDRGAADGRPQEGSRGRSGLDETCPVTAAIRSTDGLDVRHVGPAIDRRYGTERRARTADGRLDVRASRLPAGDDDGFEAALVDQFGRWADVSDLDGVVAVVGSGTAEGPWVATERTGPSIAGREHVSVRRALRQATQLAGALADLHARGVVHAGIDPGNVVLTDGRDGPPRPTFHNVGLVDVYRRYEDPAAVLDPRYAAPEYFGEERAVVDRATDVYGLGALCFRLFTGVAPVAGTPEAIVERVTDDQPIPRPSRVEPDLPEAVDDVLRTATATDKFARYDTARDFRDALEAARADAAW